MPWTLLLVVLSSAQYMEPCKVAQCTSIATCTSNCLPAFYCQPSMKWCQPRVSIGFPCAGKEICVVGSHCDTQTRKCVADNPCEAACFAVAVADDYCEMWSTFDQECLQALMQQTPQCTRRSSCFPGTPDLVFQNGTYVTVPLRVNQCGPPDWNQCNATSQCQRLNGTCISVRG